MNIEQINKTNTLESRVIPYSFNIDLITKQAHVWDSEAGLNSTLHSSRILLQRHFDADYHWSKDMADIETIKMFGPGSRDPHLGA